MLQLTIILRKIKTSSLRSLLSFSQITAYVLCILPLRYYANAKRVFHSDVTELHRGALIIANHVSILDPFVILAHFPLGTFLQLLPIRFPISAKYFRRPFLGKFLTLLGGYDAGVTRKEVLLMMFQTRTYLRQSETIFLFPEGKINADQLGNFSRGVEFFASDAAAVAVIKTEGLHFRSARNSGDRRIIFLDVRRLKPGDKIPADSLREMFLKAQ